VPKQLETGWACFAEVVEPDVAGAVAAILDDPAPLAAATLAAAPPTLVHGDLRDDNLGLTRAGIALIDWGLAAWAPAAVDLAWFLLHVAWRIDAPREALLDDFRAAEAERHSEAALDLALLGGLATYGWLLGHSAVVHPDPAERTWARDELEWWSERARRGLERL
jgi:aminoglycoside phosphotransferase (APT) family kinase protein